VSQKLLLPVLLLALATLACGGGRDVNATVNAVNTAVQQTLVAMTAPSTSGPATNQPPTNTLQPTLGVPAATVTTAAPPAATTPAPPTVTNPAPVATTQPAPATVQPRPNGLIYHATRRDPAPAIDGNAGDWPDPLPNTIDQNVFRPENWGGTSDLGARWAAGWDANNLYLIALVTDDTHVQIEHGELLYRGDSMEIQLDADLAGDFNVTSLSGDDHQLGLSSGGNRESPEYWLWNPPAKSGTPGGIVLTTHAGAAGGDYVLEIAIPWSLYGVTPAGGMRFGFSFNASDNDNAGTAEQQTMISSVSTRTLLNPTTWGTLELDP
jgi:hypothetical protein